MRTWGVDGCRKGWFCVNLGAPEWRVVADLREIADDEILIDIPIGLGGDRRCDREARRVLAPHRASSVFSVPCREAVYAESYEKALAINREIVGKGLSKQAWNLVGKIREVDGLVRGGAGRIRESHPEVCFWGLAGRPMEHGKKTREGVQERLAVLERHLPNARVLVAQAHLEHGGFDAARDDILDAFVLALCAGRADRATLPELPDRDELDLPMEMVYAPLCARDAPPPDLLAV